MFRSGFFCVLIHYCKLVVKFNHFCFASSINVCCPACVTALCTPHDFTVLETTVTSVKVMWVCERVTDTTLSTYQLFVISFGTSEYSAKPRPIIPSLTTQPIYFNSTHQGALIIWRGFVEGSIFSAFYGATVSVEMQRIHQNNVQSSNTVQYVTPCAGLYDKVLLVFVL